MEFHLCIRLELRADLGFKFELKIERKAIDKKRETRCLGRFFLPRPTSIVSLHRPNCILLPRSPADRFRAWLGRWLYHCAEDPTCHPFLPPLTVTNERGARAVATAMLFPRRDPLRWPEQTHRVRSIKPAPCNHHLRIASRSGEAGGGSPCGALKNGAREKIAAAMNIGRGHVSSRGRETGSIAWTWGSDSYHWIIEWVTGARPIRLRRRAFAGRRRAFDSTPDFG
jgi:hypothetical protein